MPQQAIFGGDYYVFSMFRCPDVTPMPPTLAFLSVFTPTQHAAVGWRGGLVVGRRTCDLVVAGSRPGRDAAA